MFVHVVLMRFERAEFAEEAATRLLALKDVIDVVERLDVGMNESPADDAYELGLVVGLGSRQDLARYESHPAHEEVAGFIREHRVSSARCDFFSR